MPLYSPAENSVQALARTGLSPTGVSRYGVVVGQPSGGQGWTPADLDGTTGLRWYDFSDESTISDTGGLVDSVADKYAGGFDLAGAGSTRPTSGATTLEGRNVVDFDVDYLTAAAAADWAFLHDGTEHLITMVAKIGGVANPNAFYGLWGTNGTASSNRGAACYFDDRASVPRDEVLIHQVTFGTSSQFNANNSTSDGECPPNSWQIISILSDPDNATAADRSTVALNRGRPIKNNSDTSAISAGTPAFPFQLGAAGNNVAGLVGSIAEVVISSSGDDRSDIEAYLATKYGLAPFAVQPASDQVVITA